MPFPSASQTLDIPSQESMGLVESMSQMHFVALQMKPLPPVPPLPPLVSGADSSALGSSDAPAVHANEAAAKAIEARIARV
jgi:hypothetical protein